MKLLIINGPNLGRLGRREPSIYGATTMEEALETLRAAFPMHTIEYYQSNVEGLLIDCLEQAADEGVEGIALNAGAYTHTSIALHDAIRSIGLPVIEVHLSNVHQREAFRHHSMIAGACRGVICGFGMLSYRLAIEALVSAE